MKNDRKEERREADWERTEPSREWWVIVIGVGVGVTLFFIFEA